MTSGPIEAGATVPAPASSSEAFAIRLFAFGPTPIPATPLREALTPNPKETQ